MNTFIPASDRPGPASDTLRILFIADCVGYGLDPRYTRTALTLARFTDVVLGTWEGDVDVSLKGELAAYGVRVLGFRYPIEKGLGLIRSVRELADAFDAEHIDVVHCQCYRHLVLSKLASSCATFGPAVVFTDNNGLGWRGAKAVARLSLLSTLRPEVINLSNHVSALRTLPKRSAWIPNGVDTSYFCFVSRPPDFLGGISVIYPGRLDPNKGHGDLLKICSRLRRSGFEFRLVLAGDGPNRARLETLVGRLDLRDVVRFAGHLSRAELKVELASADIGVFPSYAEMCPNAVLEMMATGLPVVAYAAGAIPLLLRDGNTGFVVPVGDDGGVEEHLKQLIAQPEVARRIGREAASDARARFDIVAVAQDIVRFYRGCAAHRAPGMTRR